VFDTSGLLQDFGSYYLRSKILFTGPAGLVHGSQLWDFGNYFSRRKLLFTGPAGLCSHERARLAVMGLWCRRMSGGRGGYAAGVLTGKVSKPN
jgi:hypothetical protein